MQTQLARARAQQRAQLREQARADSEEQAQTHTQTDTQDNLAELQGDVETLRDQLHTMLQTAMQRERKQAEQQMHGYNPLERIPGAAREVPLYSASPIYPYQRAYPGPSSVYNEAAIAALKAAAPDLSALGPPAAQGGPAPQSPGSRMEAVDETTPPPEDVTADAVDAVPADAVDAVPADAGADAVSTAEESPSPAPPALISLH